MTLIDPLTNEGTPERHHKERQHSVNHIIDNNLINSYFIVSLEHVVKYDSYGVVQKRLAKHNDVQYFIDVNLFEDGQHRNRIDRRYQWCKQEGIENGGLDVPVNAS